MGKQRILYTEVALPTRNILGNVSTFLSYRSEVSGGYRGCSTPNDQRRRFCRAIFLVPRKNPGTFHLCNSLIEAFCTNLVLYSLWKMNRNKGSIVFGPKDDDVQV